MFEESSTATPGRPPSALPESALSMVELEALVDRLTRLDTDVDDVERVTQLGLLERVKGAVAAAQARVSVAFDESQREVQASRGVPTEKQGGGVADQIALARRDSRARGSRHLGLAKALVHELPQTMAALTAGRISEWRATIMARETAVLTLEDRREVDARLADELDQLGDRQLAARAKALGYQLDPESVLRRIRGANSDRRVSIRPAPDTMSYVTGFLPVAQGVAVHAALTAAAASAKALGDERTKAQIMADTFVERVTGQASAPAVPVEVQLIMTDRTLFGGDSVPAQIPGHGPIPASFARDLVSGRLASAGDELVERAQVWLRRLYTSPTDGSLVAMDSRRRTFDGLLRHFLITRDQVCRTPWCDAPIRHIDHVVPAAEDGSTTADNGQGLCESCNYTKEMPGWHTKVLDRDRSGRHRTLITTPTGHTYQSTAPPLLGLDLMTASPLVLTYEAQLHAA